MDSISLINKNYDESNNSLTGFDIVFNKERIHVDLSNYQLKSKSESEVRQIREDIYNAYQMAINSDYPSKEALLMTIAKDFPDGIAWISPEQKNEKYINTDVLHMQGIPNRSFVDIKGYGEAFLKLHEWRSSSQKHEVQLESDAGNTSLSEAISIIEKNGNLSNEQTRTLNYLIAESINMQLTQQQSNELE